MLLKAFFFTVVICYLAESKIAPTMFKSILPSSSRLLSAPCLLTISSKVILLVWRDCSVYSMLLLSMGRHFSLFSELTGNVRGLIDGLYVESLISKSARDR